MPWLGSKAFLRWGVGLNTYMAQPSLELLAVSTFALLQELQLLYGQSRPTGPLRALSPIHQWHFTPFRFYSKSCPFMPQRSLYWVFNMYLESVPIKFPLLTSFLHSINPKWRASHKLLLVTSKQVLRWLRLSCGNFWGIPLCCSIWVGR